MYNFILSKLIAWSRVLLEKLTSPQLVKKFLAFMELEGSFPHSQEITNCLYSEPDQSSPYPHSTIWRSLL